ncbi:MAG: acyl-CoA dehydrogenase family protein [Rhodothermales bacterium]
MSQNSLSNLKKVSAEDRKMIRDIEKMLGPEPTEIGFVKNLFSGRFRSDLVFPYPKESKSEREKCDKLLEELEAYMRDEHPSVLIDREEYIPEWALKRLFDMGVMGMTVPEEYDGLGLGVTSYNRVLEVIGKYCGSTSVVVSAHQSIGCKAIMLFGTEEQKKEFLPKVARQYLSAFCLSEPQVGSDAAGQETNCEVSEDGTHFILNGEKKWSTSGALAGMFTVMAKQQITDAKTGKTREAVTTLICTPDMEGVDIFQKNRSKTGIRGTWQARVRFTNVKVPRERLLHKEGKGLNVALTCLNYGRCTLSAGVFGGAKRAKDQSIKWVQTRYQFGRPLAEFELVQQRIARMSAYCYGMEAMLYMMTGMLDRHDKDIMVETAITKVFCSDMGWRVIDDAMQIMGGEGYVTENELDRIWRDNRIHRIVEGSNEVMQSFIFGYGGKQLAESMVGIQQALTWDTDDTASANITRILGNSLRPEIMSRAIPLGAQLFLGVKPVKPEIKGFHPLLEKYTNRLSSLIQKHGHSFKLASKWHREEIVKRQVVQARIADNAIYLFALSASLSKMDAQIRNGDYGLSYERDRTALGHLFDLLELDFAKNIGELKKNADESMRLASDAARRHNDSLANEDYYIHESSPVAKGTGKPVRKENVRQFPGDMAIDSGGDGAAIAPEDTKLKATTNKSKPSSRSKKTTG